MKVAFIGQKGIPAQQGGIEKHVEELSAKLAQAGLNVTVYCRSHYTGNNNKSFAGIRTINLPSLKTKNLDAISHTFLATLHALFQNYDIIHYHGVGPSLLSWLPRIFAPQTKVIATFHCIDRKHQKWSRFAKLMLKAGEWAACRFPHQTITVSQALKKYCQQNFNRETTYIPNGVSITHNENEKILANFDLKQNNYFLAVSRLVRHKGLHTLIRAYQQITTDKKLVIVGAGTNTDSYVDYLRQLAKDNNKIIFTGQQSGANLEALFRNAYLFVQPSEAEGLSIALLEAIAYGTPTLISDIEENLEIAKGLAKEFKNKDIAGLAQQLSWSEQNQEAIKTQAAEAEKIINQKYNWQQITKATIALYQQALTSKNPRRLLTAAFK
ncbi:MAG TPA: glycosyltransferase family 4 protein [bacterium]|nr:glycosyltransferase family 4 protein [bacterium]HNS33845.1 glycosyltransferase family 4 protein [bacterium]HNZ73647.1 glycosyltransferase family 4 protein [bacterium]HOH67454.1 glycosyltransferase family 4 protein [bacterium]